MSRRDVLKQQIITAVRQRLCFSAREFVMSRDALEQLLEVLEPPRFLYSVLNDDMEDDGPELLEQERLEW